MSWGQEVQTTEKKIEVSAAEVEVEFSENTSTEATPEMAVNSTVRSKVVEEFDPERVVTLSHSCYSRVIPNAEWRMSSPGTFKMTSEDVVYTNYGRW